ncbi:RDD family protein [Undibacterium sp. FT137W]|uniref:RDD family protein n=2 Tax=Undibacterium fentianense TaxID=2828728 RepID=A0A941IDU3_9BURK|nr:RDD family protein [Undibacterium fentianense]
MLIYEAALVFGVVFFASFVFDVSTQSKSALSLRLMREVFLFFVIGGYFVFFWRRSGQTLAMQTWRIKLVNDDLGKVPLVKAIVRYCLAWLWVLPGFILSYQFGLKNAQLLIPVLVCFCIWASLTFFAKDGQFLHDKLAKTRLIQLPKQNSST